MNYPDVLTLILLVIRYLFRFITNRCKIELQFKFNLLRLPFFIPI